MGFEGEASYIGRRSGRSDERRSKHGELRPVRLLFPPDGSFRMGGRCGYDERDNAFQIPSQVWSMLQEGNYCALLHAINQVRRGQMFMFVAQGHVYLPARLRKPIGSFTRQKARETLRYSGCQRRAPTFPGQNGVAFACAGPTRGGEEKKGVSQCSFGQTRFSVALPARYFKFVRPSHHDATLDVDPSNFALVQTRKSTAQSSPRHLSPSSRGPKRGPRGCRNKAFSPSASGQ